MNIVEQERMCKLFALYSELFTDNQKELFISYYYDDMSLQEISDNLNVSRNAIYSQLKRIENSLNSYESKLHLQEYYNKLNNLLDSDLNKEELIKEIKKLGGNY